MKVSLLAKHISLAIAILHLLSTSLISCSSVSNEESSKALRRAQLDEEFYLQDIYLKENRDFSFPTFDPDEKFDFLETEEMSLDDLTKSLFPEQPPLNERNQIALFEQQEASSANYLLPNKWNDESSKSQFSTHQQYSTISSHVPHAIQATSNTPPVPQENQISLNKTNSQLFDENLAITINSYSTEISGIFTITDEDLNQPASNVISRQSRQDIIKKKKFIIRLTCHKLPISDVWFKSNSLENIFSFNYAIKFLDSLGLEKGAEENNLRMTIMDNLKEIFLVVSSLPLHLRPFCYSFKYRHRPYDSMRRCYRIPMYFLFTTISFLLETQNSKDYPKLKRLIGKPIGNFLSPSKFSSPKWKFMKDFADEFGIVKSFYCNNYKMFHDISTVSFIYTQINHPNKKVRDFFTNTWNVYKTIFNESNSHCLSADFSLHIPIGEQIGKIKPIEKAVRKLYQIEFTDLVLDQRESMNGLLIDYSQLKWNFGTRKIDFRQRCFGRSDFEKLKNSMSIIKKWLAHHSKMDKNLKSFLMELEYFTNFKSFLFAYDFCNELTIELDCAKYLAAFKNIKKISILFQQIRSLLSSKGIPLEPVRLGNIDSRVTNCPLTLGELANKFISFIEMDDIEICQITKCLSKELDSFLKDFPYFKVDFSYLHLPRLRCTEFVDELEEILFRDNENAINEIFEKEKYKLLRDQWSFNSEVMSQFTTPESKNNFLRHLKINLFLYNQ